ncbi:MAG: NUDIX hydrolase [Acidobacteriaceae bacterium]|jgi:ADP-ribose pyrophosphatase
MTVIPNKFKSAKASTAKRAAKKTAAKKSVATKPAAKKPRTAKPRLLSSKLAFQGRVFNVFTDTLVEPGGHRHIKDVIRHNGSVVMMAVDERKNPADPDVILERQYRHAAGQFLLELPAGSRNPGEAPLAAAKRELIEETGFRARRWTMLIRYFASPGFLGEWMQIYLARDLREGAARPELDEQIEVLRVPLSQAMKMIAGGKIHDGKTLIGLSLYDAARREGRL